MLETTAEKRSDGTDEPGSDASVEAMPVKSPRKNENETCAISLGYANAKEGGGLHVSRYTEEGDTRGYDVLLLTYTMLLSWYLFQLV